MGGKCQNVKVTIRNSEGKVAFTKTFSLCKAKTAYSFLWNGKTSKNKNVPVGEYHVTVQAGEISTNSDSLMINKK